MNPSAILDLNYSFSKTAVMIAAVRLKFFTHLSGRKLSAVELAVRAGTIPDATERFLVILVRLGLVEMEDDVFRLAPMAEHFLVEGKSTYVGKDTMAMLDFLPAWLHLDQTLVTGEPYRDLGMPAEAERFFAPRVLDVFPLIFPIATRLAETLDLSDTTRELRILDVAAGSGVWSIALARRYPNAVVTAIDLPAVTMEGKRKVAELGLSRRYTWMEGDALTLPLEAEQFDVAIVAHFCRFLGKEKCQLLFSKLERALSPDGIFVLADIVLPDNPSSALFPFMLDLSMLVNSAHGRTFTVAEFGDLLKGAGFAEVTSLDVPAPTPLIKATKRVRPCRQ
ncbi:MAG: methyltransferase domain-containing protein [Gammaproteobacteria bacterium]|nr:methyltransferase domain-containing protein [Gammaproteobacteria bacterium]